jgi:hypothetical protein
MRELARDLRFALDAVTFAQALGLSPDPWQDRVLRWGGKRLLLNCSRQAGKSTTTAFKALHHAIYEPNAMVLLVSPSLRQSSELFRKVTSALEKVPGAPRRLEDNRLSLEFENGSRIVALPSSEATIRGFSGVTLIIEDEAAFVTDDLYTALRPMLATSGGRLVLMSTPFGRRGHFYDAWSSDDTSWERVEVRASDVPRISTAFLEEERNAIGSWRFRQEYECEFVDTVDSLFTHQQVSAAVTNSVKPLFGGGA